MTQKEKHQLTVLKALCSIVLENDKRIEDLENKITEIKNGLL